jgi:hypothetical protein
LANAFLEQYRFNTKSILEYLGLKEDEEPYVILDLGVNEVIVEIKGKTEISSLPALTNDEEEEEKSKTPPTNDLNTITTTDEEEEQVKPPPPAKSPNNGTTIAEEVRTDPPVEDLSIDAITTEGDSTTLPIRRCQQGEETKMWTSVPLLQRISSSNE